MGIAIDSGHISDHDNNYIPMKLAACYTVFDGTELLKASISTIAPHIDMVVICWQNISNKGNPINSEDFDTLAHLGTIQDVHLTAKNPDPLLNAKENERRKHNHMIDYARAQGATHFLMAACDHFYEPKLFESAKKFVQEGDYDATFTAMYTYYKKPTWRITPIEDYYMPFICKLHPETKIQRVPNFPLLVDPSVQMNTLGKWLLFQENEIMLHHYSMIRRDINGKFRNAASPWKPIQIDEFTREWNEYDIKENPGVKYFKERKIKEVRDYFNLNSIL